MTPRMRILLLVPASLLFAFQALAVPVHQWSQRFGSTGDDLGHAVAVDGAGNVIVTGYFLGTADFGGGNLTSVGGPDIFLAKYAASGAHLWSKRFGSTQADEGFGVDVDASGNVIVTGHFRGTVDFGGGGLTSTGGSDDLVVAKYDADGGHMWSQRFGGTGYEVGLDAAVDASGNVIVTGLFYGTADFGGGNLMSSSGLPDIFVAKYDAGGSHVWSRSFGGTSDERGIGVAADGSGNVLLTGQFQGTVNFGGDNLTSANADDIFVAKFDAGGTHHWSQRFGSVGFDWGRHIAADASGDVIVTGQFSGTVDFGGGDLIATGDVDVFVAKYDANGVHKWSRNFANTGNERGEGLAVDGSDNVIVTGLFDGTVDFGGGVLTAVGGSTDIFVATLDAGGAHQWSRSFGNAGLDYGYGVAADAVGGVILTGQFRGMVDFGGGDLVAAGSSADIYLVKYRNEEPTPVLITGFDATPRGIAVEVTWKLWRDEALDRFTLFRRDGASNAIVIASGDAEGARSYTDTSVQPGETYHYELLIRTAGGDEFRSAPVAATVARLTASLSQNVPNPFNPQTTIEYAVDAKTSVSIEIFDASGSLVARLDQGERDAGTYRATWAGRDSAGRPVVSGVYFYRLAGVREAETRKMILLK